MSKKFLLIILTVALMMISCSCVTLAGSQDFTLANETGMDIYEVYVSPYHSDNWEEDVLDVDILRDGEEVDITFNGTKETYWDIMVKDKQGNEFEWEKFNLKEISVITIFRDGSKLWAEYE